MAQVASMVMMHKTENAGKIGYFMSAEASNFGNRSFPETPFSFIAKCSVPKSGWESRLQVHRQ